MSSNKKVVVYGASGYTGKLISEFLIKKGIPFVAAGRNLERLESEMRTVPGGNEADYEIAAVDHSKEALLGLFSGRQVVVNVVGPFGQFGDPVVEACYDAGCHYIDTTGETDWGQRLRTEWHEKFVNKDLLLAPATAYMWTAGLLAAEICLETKGIDSVDIVYSPGSSATIASTLSFMRMVSLDQYYLANNQLVPWPMPSRLQLALPDRHEILTGLPWGGGFEPLWFADDDRVRNCKVAVGFGSPLMVDALIGRMTEYQEAKKTKSQDELEALTTEWGMQIASTPPREIEDVHTSIISCKGRGRTVGKNVTLYGTSAYLQTGALAAEATKRILDHRCEASGFASPAKAFGARNLMASLANDGLHAWQELAA